MVVNEGLGDDDEDAVEDAVEDGWSRMIVSSVS